MRSSWIDSTARFLTFVGILWAIGSAGYFVNGLTQAGGGVDVIATPSAQVGENLRDCLQAQLPDTDTGVAVEGSNVSTVELEVWDSTPLEQALVRLDVLLGGLAVLASALLLSRILKSIAAGDPFAPENARRFLILAGVAFTYALTTGFAAPAGARSALDRIGMSGPDAPLQAYTPDFDLFSLVVVPFALMVLAESFRRGGDLRDDVEGLI